MSTTTKAVKKRNDDHAKANKKIAERLQKSEALQAQEKSKAAAQNTQVLKRKMVNAKQFLEGCTIADSANVVRILEGDDQIKTFGGKEAYDQPFMIKDCSVLTNLLKEVEDNTSAGFWLKKWHLSDYVNSWIRTDVELLVG